ncbi:S24 family peptidase [Kordiimonas aquimaris]|uniref:S24 family peptidase n=1 Tax=Kordiimonas aquimaris TaxID=707591 RepID=UPI0021CFC98F|nr:S24 family peptidase [Kordiimonas aquimaris]
MNKNKYTREKDNANILIEPVLFDCVGAQGSYRHTKKRPISSTQDLPFSTRKSLPVRGRAQGGSEGNVIVEENPIDWTFRPADLQGVNDAFAVYVSGASMTPKYKNGDLIYVHPSRAVAKGRFVLVETKEHKGFIKQFVAWRNDTLILQQFNPSKEIRLPKSEVLRVMLAIGSLDC